MNRVVEWFESLGESVFGHPEAVYLICFGLIFLLLFVNYLLNDIRDQDVIEIMERLEAIEKHLGIDIPDEEAGSEGPSEDEKKEA